MDEKRVYEVYYAFEAASTASSRTRSWRSTAAKRKACSKCASRSTNATGALPSKANFEEDILSPFADQLILAEKMPPSACCCRPSSAMCAANLAKKPTAMPSTSSPPTCAPCSVVPPLAGHVTLGLDPGFRTGCKVAVVDPTGKLLDTGTIYPHEPKNDWTGALTTLEDMVNRHHVTLITIGNGTASRETEKLVAELTRAWQSRSNT